MKFNKMQCRKCKTENPFIYFAPAKVADNLSICVCYDCAKKAGYLDSDGNLKKGYSV